MPILTDEIFILHRQISGGGGGGILFHYQFQTMTFFSFLKKLVAKIDFSFPIPIDKCFFIPKKFSG